MKILLIEDDELTANLLVKTLTIHGYTVDVASDGAVGINLATSLIYDLILLDICIPKLDGISFCHRIRSQGYEKPILLLTAKDSTRDLVAGLDAGADDYVTKPYKPPELLARIRALLRRRETGLAPSLLAWGDLVLNPVAAEVTYQEQVVPLTTKEFSLLELFLNHPQRVFNRSAIIDRLWSLDASPGEATVTNLIKNLRQKLKAVGMADDLFETIYGMGYRLKPPPRAIASEPDSPSREAKKRPKKPPEKPEPEPVAATPSPSWEPNMVAVDQVLEGLRETILERLAPLESLVQAIEKGNGTPDLLQQVAQTAHKLVGSLGMLGYAQGSQLARDLEYLVLGREELKPPEIHQLTQWVAALQQEVTRRPSPEEGKAERCPPPEEDSPPLALSQVLLIGHDSSLLEQLQGDAGNWGFAVALAAPGTFDTVSSAQEYLHLYPPDLVLFNLVASDLNPDLLQAIASQFPTLPLLVLTDQDDLRSRVVLSRLGIQRYLHRPSVSTRQILEAMAQALVPSASDVERILIVDDDPIMLVGLRNILQPWGLEVTTLADPTQFWRVLTATQPNLLLLDLEMPTFNGVDLCQVVRQDPQWGDLPILVVTAHTDTESLQRVFAAGADDFIRKPVFEPELITRVMSRINRSRLQQQPERSPTPLTQL